MNLDKFRQASKDLHAGKFKTVKASAQKHGVNYKTLWERIKKRDGKFSG